MENKSIVTCNGDQNLFSRLHPIIVQNLPKERIEWKRSFGRPSRHINVEANFVPYKPELLCDEDDWTLLGRPFFHTFWTECDIDVYKATVKDEISDWVAALRQRNCPDWLVVVVVNDDNKVKNKILRNSVYDKVKSDFCSKQTDRCIVLTEPFRQDNRSADGWCTLLLRIRQLLLQSYNRNLTRFEDHMRNERERRTERGWNFFRYFMVQEELAFMLEMLGIYEDALVQYDELDALFTQFILNHSAGDKAGWISELAERKAAAWGGLCLTQPINIEKRQLIKNSNASLLDFRVYLFSRQCTLFYLQMRPWEVAQRAIPFMHNTIQELNLLKIRLPPGAVSVWVYLSCMEVMRTCKKFTSTGHMEPYSLHTANLWDYARIRLVKIGEISGLFPGTETTDEHHSESQKLVAGADAEHSEPLDTLKGALTSKQDFQKHYLELSELAMGTYKHIGRIRSARQIGRDLALFYMKLGEHQKAEGFLLDSLKTYKEEGWDYLAEETRVYVAECQKQLNLTVKYAKTCVHIASAKDLPKAKRQHHQEEFLLVAEQGKDDPLMFQLRPAFIVQKIGPLSKTFTLKNPCVVVVTLESSLVSTIQCRQMSIGVAYESPLLEHVTLDSQSRKCKQSVPKQRLRTASTSSTSSTAGIDFYNHVSESFRLTPPRLDFSEQCERTPNNKCITSCGLVCKTPLRRIDSGPKGFIEKDVVREESESCFSVSDVLINPGVNVIELQGQLEEKGRYLLGQLCIGVTGADFLKSFLPDSISFCVVSDEPNISLLVHPDGQLIMGIPQELKLVARAGSYSFSEGIHLEIVVPHGVCVSGDHVDGECLVLPPAEEYGEREASLYITADVQDSPNPTITHELIIKFSSVERIFFFPVTFVRPLQVIHKLHTAGHKKFVKVFVSCKSQVEVDILHPKLDQQSPGVILVNLNKPDMQLRVTEKCPANYLWQIKPNSDISPQLVLQFSFKYKIINKGKDSESSHLSTFRHSFTLSDYQTLYAVKSMMSLPEPDVACFAGVSYPLTFVIKRVKSRGDIEKDMRLMYEVTSDSTSWAFSGRTTGGFLMEGDQYDTTLEAMPLVGGSIPLPVITLHRCIGQVVSELQPSQEGYSNESVPIKQAFCTGQVYYSDLATRINVIPTPNASPVDIVSI